VIATSVVFKQRDCFGTPLPGKDCCDVILLRRKRVRCIGQINHLDKSIMFSKKKFNGTNRLHGIFLFLPTCSNLLKFYPVMSNWI
jgi:hypothetical protein